MLLLYEQKDIHIPYELGIKGRETINAQSRVNAPDHSIEATHGRVAADDTTPVTSRLISITHSNRPPCCCLPQAVLGVSLCAATGQVKERYAQSGVYDLDTSVEMTHG